MTAPRKPILTEEEIREAANKYGDSASMNGMHDYRAARDFTAGARFALAIYEARLAEAILLMKEAAPAIDTISSGLSERFDRFLAVHAKEDKP